MFGINNLRYAATAAAQRLDELEHELSELKKEKPEKVTIDFSSRLAEVETKLAKLWAVLVKIDDRGTERHTRAARVLFGGKRLE